MKIYSIIYNKDKIRIITLKAKSLTHANNKLEKFCHINSITWDNIVSEPCTLSDEEFKTLQVKIKG